MAKARALTSVIQSNAPVLRAGLKVAQRAALCSLIVLVASCSREKIDWRSAEAADTIQAYDRFLERHPDGMLATQARARIAQLNEERDWKQAIAADTPEAYRRFLARHENGKWAEEARIRIETFSLESGPRLTPATLAAEAYSSTPTSPPAGSASSAPPPAASAATAPARSPAPTAPVSTAAAAGASGSASPAAVNRSSATSSPPPQTGAGSAGQFGIQLGAFRSEQAALRDWKRLQTRFDRELHGLSGRVVPVTQSAGQLFRLQAIVGEEARARGICAALTRQSQPCVIVLPPPR